jgi:penicillin-binding protein 1B
MSALRKESRGTKPRRRRASGRRYARWIVGLGVPAAVAIVVLLIVVYAQITLSFEGRVWRLPSRVYSASLRLAPGMTVDRAALVERLVRSGYARIDAAPSRPGQFRVRPSVLEINVRAFREGARGLPARPVAIGFDGNTIAGLADERGRPIAAVEIEPELLALVFGPRQEERQVVRLADVPQLLIRAVLAAEDARFYEHGGLDPRAIARATFKNVSHGRIVQGGSTITQQTVKNLYLGQERTWWRKLREALMSVILDSRYSKDRILEVYLNEVYLGQRGSVAICGMESASRYYFGRSVGDLSLGEAATLAGLIRNPGGYNPFLHPDRAKERRDTVLDAMVEQRFIDPQAAAAAKKEPLRLASGGAGFAQAPYVVDLVRSQIAEMYSPKVLAEDGLEIFTTIDTLVQDQAEKALDRGLTRLEHDVSTVHRQLARRRLQGAVLVTDPRTGAILALVGGRDYQDSQFNRATQARRQPGSCFKPFVYLAAFEAAAEGIDGGLTPASLLDDDPLELTSGGKDWRPENYDGTYGPPVTARDALEHSLNVPTIRAALGVGLDRVIEAARRCGLPEHFEPLPSLALGAQEVTPLDLARAYGTLAASGLRAEPRIVSEVDASDGRKLERQAPEIKQVARPEVVYLVDDVLRGVLTEGTAASSASLGFRGDAAGKTGTTDDTRDAWFVGFTPELLSLVWVGYDDNAKTGLTGSAGALPIWVDLMMHVRHRWAGSTFAEPPGIERVDIDPESGGLAVDGCPQRRSEVFLAGTEPDPCPLHQSAFKRWWHNLFHRDKRRKTL